ncbi:transposable element Tcb1 transposase [Trichonephila clavipes]|nr:transposable element Tcb1 transposase [Trichonephila clavipes]
MSLAEWIGVVFTDESRICLQHHDGRIRVWKQRGERMLNSCVMHRHTAPAPGILIELLPWPARSPDLSPIENMWSMVAQRLTQITPPAATPDQLCHITDFEVESELHWSMTSIHTKRVVPSRAAWTTCMVTIIAASIDTAA